MIPTFRTLAAAAAGAALCAVTAAAQQPPARGDKSRGEESQIRQRLEWFNRQRGLEELERPNLMRRRAVEQARAMRDALPESQIYLEWEQLGPEAMTMLGWAMGNVAGRVSAVAVRPGDESTIYLGAASGGLWKTSNGGASWSSIFDDVGTETIGSIFIDPAAPDAIWVGTGEQGNNCWSYFGMGLYRSSDGGQTWQERNGSGGDTLDLSYVTAVVVHPTDPNVVLAGGESWCSNGGWYYGGLFRSTNGGDTWTKVLSGAIGDVLVDPDDPNRWYAGMGRWGNAADGVYTSTDAGATWQVLTNGIPSGSAVGRIRLAMAPSDSQTLYALIQDSGGASLYKTIDGGASWTTQNAAACEGQCWYDLCLAVHPQSPSTLLVGSIRFAHSTDSGVTLTYLTEGWGGSQQVHQDTHVLLYSTQDPNRYWIGGDGGLWRTDNNGGTFVNLNSNLDITQFYDIAVHPDDPQTLFGGSQDNSSERRSGSNLWDVTVCSGDGFMNIIDPANPEIVFQTSYPWDGLPSLCKSTAFGAPNSCNWISSVGLVEDEPYPWVTPLAAFDLDAATPTALFLGSNHVYRSTTTEPYWWFEWTKISPNLTDNSSDYVTVLTPVRNGGKIMLYAGTSNGRVWRTDDALAETPTWSNVTGDYPGGTVTDLAADASDPKRVFLTRGEFGASRLYRSSAGGTTWAAVGPELPNAPANAVAIDPADPSRVYVGSDVGVFESRNGGDSFVAAMVGLPLGAVVTDLEIDDDPHVLTAGTYGRGAWQTSLDLEEPMFADGFESGDTSAWSFATP